ncbi:hypothetical protein 51.1rMVA_191 [Vaccinia virus]|nr:hypothetical protein 51.1rMVA_191 [Vaccinia virus]
MVVAMDGVIVYCLNALVKHGEEINHIKNDFMIKPCCEKSQERSHWRTI